MAADATQLAQQQLEDILTFFGINPQVSSSRDGDVIELVVETDATGRLIGYHGETLRSLQHIVNAVFKTKSDEQVFISVDVAGYKKARAHQLGERAKKTAATVLETGNEIELAPMPAADRRAVHAALGEVEGVRSESRGEGADRRLVIIPVKTTE